jgi:hypothetical protein
VRRKTDPAGASSTNRRIYGLGQFATISAVYKPAARK